MPGRNETEVVLHHTGRWFQHSEWSMERFAHDLLAPALVEAKLLAPLEDPLKGDDYLKQRKAWGQQIARIFHGTKPFPLEWKWAWISQVPKPYQQDMLDDLLALAGCLNVPIPEIRAIAGVQATAARMGDVLLEFGEFVTASALPAGDGHYSRQDCPAAVREMLDKGVDAVQALLAELQALATGAGAQLPALDLLRGVRHG